MHQYLSKAIQDDARRAGERGRLHLEAQRARAPRRPRAGPAAPVRRLALAVPPGNRLGHLRCHVFDVSSEFYGGLSMVRPGGRNCVRWHRWILPVTAGLRQRLGRAPG